MKKTSHYNQPTATFQSPTQLLPMLPHSPGLDDIHRITPHGNLRSSHYPVIPPLTPPGNRNSPRQVSSPPQFPHTSYDLFDDRFDPLDDPYGISSSQYRRHQQRPSFSETRDPGTFNFREAHNPLHVLLDNERVHSYSATSSQQRQTEAKSLEIPTREFAAEMLYETTSEIIHSLAQDMSAMAQQRLWEIYSKDRRYYHPCLTSIQDDVLNEELRGIVKEVINEMVTDYFKSRTTMERLVDEKPEHHFKTDNIPEIFSEVFANNVSEELYNETLSSIVADAVHEIIKPESQNKASSKNKVSRLMTDVVIDGLELDKLLMKLVNHRKVWNDSEIKDMLLDGILASELTQLFHLMSTEGKISCDVLPLKRFHENTTTDYSLDYLLVKLSGTLDEDLEDLLEYEYEQEMTATKPCSQTR